MKGAESYVSL